MKARLIILLTLVLLSSCSNSFYQVYTTKSNNLQQKDNSLSYENNDCEVSYNLWAESGNSSFTIYNKSDKNLFIVLSQSFYIVNNVAYDYFQNREYEQSIGNGVSLLATSNSLYSFKNSQKVLYKEKPIVCIPPKSIKKFGEYSILSSIIRDCDRAQMYPSKKPTVSEFDKKNTPLTFKNRITYSFDKDGVDVNSLENEFWISEITNYRSKMIRHIQVIDDCNDSNLGKSILVFMISAPNKFYNSYIEERAFKNY